jgi:NAD(P)H-hydrate epimerase
MPKAAIPTEHEGLPVATSAFMRELDRLAAEKGLDAAALMDKAGKAVALGVLDFLKGTLGISPAGATVAVAAGRGSNGGDGLVAARYLKENGVDAPVFMIPPKADGGYPAPVERALALAKESGVQVEHVSNGFEALAQALDRSTAVLDALLGTGTTGKPAGPARRMIQAIAQSKKPVVALDIPSGLDPDTGYHSGVFITASLTLTIGLAKKGLLAAHAKRYVGELKVLDIGYPPDLVKRLAAGFR